MSSAAAWLHKEGPVVKSCAHSADSCESFVAMPAFGRAQVCLGHLEPVHRGLSLLVHCPGSTAAGGAAA